MSLVALSALLMSRALGRLRPAVILLKYCYSLASFVLVSTMVTVDSLGSCLRSPLRKCTICYLLEADSLSIMLNYSVDIMFILSVMAHLSSCWHPSTVPFCSVYLRKIYEQRHTRCDLAQPNWIGLSIVSTDPPNRLQAASVFAIRQGQQRVPGFNL